MSRSNISLVALAAFLVGAVAFALIVRGAHAITYRADIGRCSGALTYSDGKEERITLAFDHSFERQEEIPHGAVANLIVSIEGECGDSARCSIVEDGIEVSKAAGRRAASCSAATAR